MGCVKSRFLEKIRLICTCAVVDSLGLYGVREMQIPQENHLICTCGDGDSLSLYGVGEVQIPQENMSNLHLCGCRLTRPL